MSKAIVEKIAGVVCRFNGLEIDDLKTPGRKAEVVEARQLTWAITKELYGNKISLACMGGVFNRDHATALSGINKAKDLRETDKEYLFVYNLLLERVKKANGEPKKTTVSEKLAEILRCNDIISMRIAIRKLIYEENK